MDNEHSEYVQTSVHDCPAELYISNTEGESNHLLWYNENKKTVYQLSSQLDYQELITMAESIKKIN